MNNYVFALAVYENKLIVGGYFTTAGGKVSAYIAQWPKHSAGVGDANGDGVIDLGDVVYLITYLYKSGPAPSPLLAGDANCSGAVELGDVVYLITYLYKGGPPPPC
jgi:hypothetical protein